MKLRNKKTGDIGELKTFMIDEKIAVWINNKSCPEYKYDSLAGLNSEWEDYEDPITYYLIDSDGEIQEDRYDGSAFDKDCKAIGNYFETKEEAEKAVEKLKAFKRLKDKGFVFVCWNDDYTIDFTINGQNTEPFKINELSRDLCVIFRGEE